MHLILVFSYGGTGNFILINTDPDGLLLSDLRFSRSYNDPTDVSKGYLDFNRDGKSDVFSAVSLETATTNGDTHPAEHRPGSISLMTLRPRISYVSAISTAMVLRMYSV